ncbi:MAG: MFS transporter [Armatimonadota bacterium]|nr:MFS transporter [Armatimonadota bacterium]
MKQFLDGILARYGNYLSTYRALACLGVVSLIAELAYAIINQSAIPPYVQEIGLTAHVGLIYAVFLGVETVFKSPLGSVGDRIGRKPLLVIGALVSSVTALVFTLTRDLWALLVLRSFDGLAAAAIWPTVTAAMSGSVDSSRRTTAMSVMIVTYISGLALGPLIGGLANDMTNSRLTSFYVVSGMFLVTALIAFFLTPCRSKEEMDASHGHDARQMRLSDLLIGLIAMPDMIFLALLAFFGIGLLIPIAKLFAMNEVGMSETKYGGLFLPVALGVASLSLFSGKLGDRWGKARSVRLGIALSALAMWAITGSSEVWEFALSAMFLGVGFVIAMPAWLALVSDMASPHSRGAVIGALGTAQGLGAVLGVASGSYLYKMVPLNFGFISFESHRTPFVVSALTLSLCFMLAVIFVHETEKRRIGKLREES